MPLSRRFPAPCVESGFAYTGLADPGFADPMPGRKPVQSCPGLALFALYQRPNHWEMSNKAGQHEAISYARQNSLTGSTLADDRHKTRAACRMNRTSTVSAIDSRGSQKTVLPTFESSFHPGSTHGENRRRIPRDRGLAGWMSMSAGSGTTTDCRYAGSVLWGFFA